MTKFTEDAIKEIGAICDQVAEKSVVRLQLLTRPSEDTKDRISLLAVPFIAIVTILVGLGALAIGFSLLMTLATQALIAVTALTTFGFLHHRKQDKHGLHEALHGEAVQHFRQLSDRDEDRRLNVLLYLCEKENRLFFVVGEHIATAVPSNLWHTISEGFEKQAKASNLEQAVVSTMKTVALLLEVSLPSLPIDADSPTAAVVQSLRTVCDPVFAQERREESQYPDQIDQLAGEVAAPYRDLGGREESELGNRAAI